MAYTKDIGLSDFYKHYKDKLKKKNKSYVDYKTFTNIIKDFNVILRSKIVYNSEVFIMPYRTGGISIRKYENVYTEENRRKWKIDFKATKEAGYKVYFGSKYGYRWVWNKKTCNIAGKKYYGFRACRTASRLVADAINNKNIDYYTV